jgi:midasin (ATPase involved in ribosome maturation)
MVHLIRTLLRGWQRFSPSSSITSNKNMHSFSSMFSFCCLIILCSIFRSSFAVRDAIVTADMVCNLLMQSNLSLFDATYNTISATLFDALPMLPFRGFKIDYSAIIDDCQAYFLSLFNELKFVPSTIGADAFDFNYPVKLEEQGVKVGKFFIQNGQIDKRWPKNYCFDAPTALLNVMRVARGLASDKPIMLEGSPGAGKSSLVKAMAELSGHQLIRINLSEQTVTFVAFMQR